jgi:hypothetical protein
MGRRLQPRVKGILPVRIWGSDREGKPFAEHVCTIDISNKGASLAGVRADLLPGDTVGLQYRNRQARFRVAWVAAVSGAPGKNVGLQCLQPEKELWPVAPPREGEDPYVPPEARLREDKCGPQENRRMATRFPVAGKVYVSKVSGGDGLWATLGDISLSGCYLQTAEPMEVGRNTSLLIRIADQQFQATAVVRSSDPGMAMRLEFTFLSNADRSTLRSVIARLEEFNTVSG